MKNKEILLGICGSISFYKAFEILSLLKKEGAKVRVMLSDGALKFINPIGFEALSNYPVLSSKNEDWQKNVNHISYSKNDLIIIAPASVNTINKLAYGICDNVFLQTLIASTCPKILAPAANNNMLENFATKKSLGILSSNNFTICEPVNKTLACGDVGRGGLQDPLMIVEMAKRVLNKDEFYADKKVVITGGATTEKIDFARGITNFSSAKMSKSLADAFYYAGANVVFISSKEFITPYPTLRFTSSKDLLYNLNSQNLTRNDILVMCAAVSDFIPKNIVGGKIKKDNFDLNLQLKLNLDILKNIKSPCKKIGFKMETDKKLAQKNAKNMLLDKYLDAVCLNILGKEINFGSEDTKIEFIAKSFQALIKFDTKLNVAKEIVELIKKI